MTKIQDTLVKELENLNLPKSAASVNRLYNEVQEGGVDSFDICDYISDVIYTGVKNTNFLSDIEKSRTCIIEELSKYSIGEDGDVIQITILILFYSILEEYDNKMVK